MSVAALAALGLGFGAQGAAAALPEVSGVELQPLAAQVKRVTEALDYLGAPLSPAKQQALEAAMAMSDEAAATRSIQEILDPLCLVRVDINPEMRVKAAQGPADPLLVEQGWRTFLIKVRNEAGATAELRVVSPHAQSLHNAPGRETASDMFFRQGEKRGGKLPREQLWLDLETFDKQPLKQQLGGLGLEYRIVSLYSRDAGRREAKLVFDVGQGTQDLSAGRRSSGSSRPTNWQTLERPTTTPA